MPGHWEARTLDHKCSSCFPGRLAIGQGDHGQNTMTTQPKAHNAGGAESYPGNPG
jgi:hypothetical protein